MRYINLLCATVNKIVGEVVNQTPVEILVHIAKAVALRGQIEHIETLVGANQGVHYARGVAWVDIVVNLYEVARNKKSGRPCGGLPEL